MFKYIHHLGAVLALLLALVSVSASASDVRIGYMPYLPYTNVLYAKEKNLIDDELKKAGLDQKVKWVQFSSGGLVSEGMAAKELDMGILGIVPATIGRSAGQNSKLIALGSTAPKSHALVVRADMNVSKVSDLKGKRVATTYGSTVYELLFKMLDEAGMTTKDVQLVNMQPADMNISLRNKTIDAAVVWDPLLPRLVAEGVVKELRDGTGINDNINVIVARGDYVKENPEVARAVLRGIARANADIKTDPDTAALMFAKTFDLPDEVAMKALHNYHYALELPESVQNQISDSINFLKEEKIIRRSVDVKDFVDLSFIK
ncbi:aliphatic sulfonate ABC transporter substrate-binding protein [Allopusillimonas ginsengisoli]|uniref:aliphatic sulfonate ABC transporter substrate-binding protein n=1 Tax=Allopusillimonas ginsengisoli TaxID=453575 RepID=UPI00101EE1D0|nr:aliphatic sulfonate ABC transporter substrate-binding protein [Allopusillimonas ginsengisoli]TEA76930.1 aliphatic sulfonate ABC transporter substrate-binding protein [Allopusillimonas ginsengisoli]